MKPSILLLLNVVTEITFSRKAGRKLTLSRVLAKSGLGKADRTEIWAAIWSRGVKV